MAYWSAALYLATLQSPARRRRASVRQRRCITVNGTAIFNQASSRPAELTGSLLSFGSISLGFPRAALSWACVRARRKKKAVHKTTSTDDKRLQNTLKRLGVNTIPGIEEVNIFMDNEIINFTNPKGACVLVSAARTDNPVSTDAAGCCGRAASQPSGAPGGGGGHAGSLLPLLLLLLSVFLLRSHVCAAVQASIAANTYVISGPSQSKSEPSSPQVLPHTTVHASVGMQQKCGRCLLWLCACEAC